MCVKKLASLFLPLALILVASQFVIYAQTATSFRFPLDSWRETCDFAARCWKPNHLGDDAEAAVDTIVYSPVNGVVKESQFHSGYGGTIIIEAFDGNEYVTILLGHLRYKKPGDLLVGKGPISIGTPIGRIAPTGENGGGYAPHLHIGIHKGRYLTADNSCPGEWIYAGYTRCPDRIFNDWYDPSDYIQARQFVNVVKTLATFNGTPWPSQGLGTLNYDIVGPNGVLIGNSVPAETANLPAGQYTLVYRNGGPQNASLTGILPSATQILNNNSTITFTLNFSAFNTVELLPYQATGYRYRILGHNEGIPTGYESSNFDDSTWAVGQAAFGFGRGYCPIQASGRTIWPENTRLLIRRSISIPANSRNVKIKIAVDNNIEEVFFNGVKISDAINHVECPILDNYEVTVPQNLVQPGQNLIVYRALDYGFETYFDTRVIADVPQQ